jgi:hypothetical protein
VSVSGRLRRKIELVLGEYAAPGRLLLAHPQPAAIYPHYLARLYYLPSTAIALMDAARQRAVALAADDEVATGLVPYLERHIEEERHGGEPGAGIVADLEAIGFDTGPLRSGPPPAKIAALVGAQYFWIFHTHPVALLGYLGLIEGFHPRREAVERLVERTGLPREGFGQLFEHADLDVAHSQELSDLLDGLPLTRFHEQLLGLSALQTIELLSDALLDVVERQSARASVP